MVRFIKTHEEWVLAAVGFFISCLLVGAIIWGVTLVSKSLGAAVSSGTDANTQIQFDLDRASKLDLRGLKKD